MQGQEGTVAESVLPSGHKILWGLFCSTLTAQETWTDHFAPLTESLLWLSPFPYSSSTLYPVLQRGDTQEATTSHPVVPCLASDILQLTQSDVKSRQIPRLCPTDRKSSKCTGQCSSAALLWSLSSAGCSDLLREAQRLCSTSTVNLVWKARSGRWPLQKEPWKAWHRGDFSTINVSLRPLMTS